MTSKFFLLVLENILFSGMPAAEFYDIVMEGVITNEENQLRFKPTEKDSIEDVSVVSNKSRSYN